MLCVICIDIGAGVDKIFKKLPHFKISLNCPI